MSNTRLKPPITGSDGYHVRPTPAPGSIRAMLLKNCNTRLFVHPLEWTADHLEALDVDLVISASTGELVADEIKRQVDESTPLLGAVWDLEHAKAISRDQQTRQLVKSTAHAAKLQHDVIESTLFFEYNKRPVAQLPPLILASRQPTQEEYSGTPIWAYTDHMWTSAARRERYTARKKSWSFATKKIKSKQELIIDPIYIAILIALAQLRSRHDPQGSKLHRVTLFVPEHESKLKPTTPQSNTTILGSRKGQRPSNQIVTKLVQYTANIPYAYLQKFKEPYKFYNATLHIEKRTLPASEPAIILQAMKTAFRNIGGCLESAPPGYGPKRKVLEELDLNADDQKRETKRREVGVL